jgi:hypothetical protein
MTITDQFPSCVDAETVESNMDERNPSPDLQEDLKFPDLIHTQKRDPQFVRAHDRADCQALLPDFHPRWGQAQLALAVLLWGDRDRGCLVVVVRVVATSGIWKTKTSSTSWANRLEEEDAERAQKLPYPDSHFRRRS